MKPVDFNWSSVKRTFDSLSYNQRNTTALINIGSSLGSHFYSI